MEIKMKKLAGERFGRLVVLDNFRERRKKAYLYYCKCICDCGEEVVVNQKYLLYGKTKSCGCLQKEIASKTLSEVAIKNNKKYCFKGTKINTLNTKINSNNTSGVKGVSWDKFNNRWKAQICIKSKNINLGRFKKKEDAVKARKRAEEKYYKPLIEEFNKIRSLEEEK